MGFLDSQQPDLTGTIITDKNLEGAKAYLKKLISRVDPHWLKKPKGHMRLNWINSGQGPVTYLVDLAYHWAVTEQALSERSRPIFEHKVGEFLKIKKDSEAENLLAEFQILSLFGNRIKPIELDPLIDPSDLDAPDRAKTPDFSFKTDGGTVWAEITVLYFEPLLHWKSNKDQMFSYLEHTLLKKPIRRIIEFNIPLKFSWADIGAWVEKELVPQFVDRKAGEAAIKINDKMIQVVWKPLPHIDADFSQHPDPRTIKFPDEKFATWNGPKGLGTILIGNVPNYSMMGVKNQSGIAVEASIQAEDVTEMIVKSIRNTLDRKRDQLKNPGYQILIAKTGHYEITPSEILGMVSDRVWPNPAYGWLSGLIIYIPRSGFTLKDKPDSIALSINPNASRSGVPLKEFLDKTLGVKA